MISSDELAQAQAFAETFMVDTCAATRGSGDPVFNPDTGQYEPSSMVIYPTPEQVAAGNPGRCRMQTSRPQPANPEAGGAVFTVETVTLQVPAGVSLNVGDLAEITDSVNPVLVGNVYRITGLSEKTHETKRTYAVEVMS
ncbi:DUF6093 family protein [Arthrobacter roseus]|uniref:DUF6093 family protein n=1 Tax=Arthrobacter roseus TaxID=136274 RepID=UPI001964CDB8|nr:hypothetical protein [Arthrobacter roseus]